MKRDLDDIFDKIIRGESRRFTKISNGERVDKFPSYFKDMKVMYKKEWETLYNPNNLFIPYIFVSIELILRQIVDINSEKQPSALNILQRLTSSDSPLSKIEDDFCFFVGKKIDENKFKILGKVYEETLIGEWKNYLIYNKNIDESDIVVQKHNQNGYKRNLYKVLLDIKKKYYTNIPGLNNSYRNAILHANKILFLEKYDFFEEILTDYSKLINSVWGDPIMPYEKDRDLSKNSRSNCDL